MNKHTEKDWAPLSKEYWARRERHNKRMVIQSLVILILVVLVIASNIYRALYP